MNEVISEICEEMDGNAVKVLVAPQPSRLPNRHSNEIDRSGAYSHISYPQG